MVRSTAVLLLTLAVVAQAAEYQLTEDLTLKLVREIPREECWRSAYTNAQQDAADAGGMRLHRYIEDTPGDYIGGAIYADSLLVRGAPVLWYGETAVRALEVLSTSNPMEPDLLTSRTVFSLKDQYRTRSGGFLVMVRCPEGTIDGLPDRVTWKVATECAGVSR